MNIELIKELVKSQKIRWTNHMVIRLLQRNISQKDIENTILNGEIIEEYENVITHTLVVWYMESV